ATAGGENTNPSENGKKRCGIIHRLFRISKGAPQRQEPVKQTIQAGVTAEGEPEKDNADCEKADGGFSARAARLSNRPGGAERPKNAEIDVGIPRCFAAVAHQLQQLWTATNVKWPETKNAPQKELG